jgi:predicted transcriptional regulator
MSEVQVKINKKTFSRSKNAPASVSTLAPVAQDVQAEQQSIAPPPSPAHGGASLREPRERQSEDLFSDMKMTADTAPSHGQAPDPTQPGVTVYDLLQHQIRTGSGNKKQQQPNKKQRSEFSDVIASSKKDVTPILGRDKRELLTRVSEYKALFPDELSSFKVKANADEDELERALSEMETIVSVGSLQNFLDEAVLTAIGMVEAGSARYPNMDITGTSQALRANPEFFKLCKLCWVKYRVFSAVPPELQLLMVVMSTAMVCRQQNVKKREISNILNQPL